MRNLEAIIEKQYKRKTKLPADMAIGSVLRVNSKIKESGKERVQAFEGVLIARKGRGLNEMITVRKISYGGIGVERIFPINSPGIESIKVVKTGKAKRAKLYYLREAFGRKAKKEARRFDTKEALLSTAPVEEPAPEIAAEATPAPAAAPAPVEEKKEEKK
jgi:large subunit ribosomal protein L19